MSAAHHRRTRPHPTATDRYLLAFERGTLTEDLVAGRLATLATTRQQLTPPPPDELTQAIADEPSAPDPALLNEVTEYLTEIISTGTSNQRKALVEVLVDHVIITGSDRLVPVFRIPNPDTTPGPHPLYQRTRPPDTMVRTMTKLVEVLAAYSHSAQAADLRLCGCPQRDVIQALEQFRRDLASGAWQARHAQLVNNKSSTSGTT